MTDIITSSEQLVVGKMYMFKKPLAIVLAPESLRVLWMGFKEFSELEQCLVYLGFEEDVFFPHMKFLLPDGTTRGMTLTGLEYHNVLGVHLVEVVKP